MGDSNQRELTATSSLLSLYVLCLLISSLPRFVLSGSLFVRCSTKPSPEAKETRTSHFTSMPPCLKKIYPYQSKVKKLPLPTLCGKSVLSFFSQIAAGSHHPREEPKGSTVKPAPLGSLCVHLPMVPHCWKL